METVTALARGAAALAALMMLAGPVMADGPARARLARLPAADDVPEPPATSAQALSKDEVGVYRRIFALQRNGEIAAADRLIATLRNRLLLGHVLAERYLHRTAYVSSYRELTRWLERYPELPQAGQIHRLALAKRPKGVEPPPPPVGGYLGGAGQELKSDRTLAAHGLHDDWQAAMAAWRREAYPNAARRFAALADVEDLDGEDLAAVSFWAARSNLRARRPQLVAGFLRRAARSSDEFYGLIAQRLLDESIDFDWHEEQVEAGSLALLLRFPAAMRAVALAAVGEPALAEDEVRRLAIRTRSSDMQALTALAERLALSSAQMRLAQQTRLIDGRRHDGAMFPLPPWQPTIGFKLDRAMVYAIVRAESAFDPGAVSHRGAMGLMQVLPDTGKLVAGDIRLASVGKAELLDPAINLSVGQQWLWRLSQTETIDDSLIHLILAYNAGEARLAGWLDGELRGLESDPLLFIESVPLAEPRAYVKKVLANLWAYRARLGQRMPSLQALAENRWPSIEHLETRPATVRAQAVAVPVRKARVPSRMKVVDARSNRR